jgi:hypothetical protein
MDTSKIITTPIIPYHQTFANIEGKEELNLEAICVFAAIGFFLEKDTYFKNKIALQPATEYQIENGQVVKEISKWKWYYDPEKTDLGKVTQEFTDLFETIVKEEIGNKEVILPISGGLDSRTQAVALKAIGAKVNAYGYRFKGGHDEVKYGRKIAHIQGYPFTDWEISEGYLWDHLDKLAELNNCYTDFINPRAMAFYDHYASLGEIFSLGHWGDVLFDDMGISDDLPFQEQVDVVLKKVVKKGGLELATNLWNQWSLTGDFKTYLRDRIEELMNKIDIQNSANARVRAFKSLYWAPRWASANMPVFEDVRPVSLPYYNDELCKFICKVPELILSGRQVQIEYLKKRSPQVAKVTWQDHRPFNLYNYKLDKRPLNLPYKVLDKIKREISSKKYIERNWELQFVGEKNESNLRAHLFDNEFVENWIPKKVLNEFFGKFKNDNPVYWAHSVAMLLTLSVFYKNQNS